MKRRAAGFTIVEILIIIVVIGILASITVLSFNGIQQQSREAGIKSDLEVAVARIDRYRSDKGEYPPVTGGSDVALREANIEIQRSLYSLDRENYLYCVSADVQSYAFVVRGINNLTYIKSTTKSFERFPEIALGSEAAVCNGQTGPGSGARSAFIPASGWRSWSQ